MRSSSTWLPDSAAWQPASLRCQDRWNEVARNLKTMKKLTALFLFFAIQLPSFAEGETEITLTIDGLSVSLNDGVSSIVLPRLSDPKNPLIGRWDLIKFDSSYLRTVEFNHNKIGKFYGYHSGSGTPYRFRGVSGDWELQREFRWSYQLFEGKRGAILTVHGNERRYYIFRIINNNLMFILEASVSNNRLYKKSGVLFLLVRVGSDLFFEFREAN